MNPGKFQEYVLKAAKQRLEFLQEHAGTKKVQDWTNETLLPRIGGRKRHGQKFNPAKNPPSALKCELQWQTMDYAINMVQNATEDQLAVLVQDTAGFQAKRARTRIVHTDATAVWLKLRGEEPVVAPDHVLSRQQATRCQTNKFKQRAKYVKGEEYQMLKSVLEEHVRQSEDIKGQVDQQFSQAVTSSDSLSLCQVARTTGSSLARCPGAGSSP